MENWKEKRLENSKELMRRFYRTPEFFWGNHIRSNANLHITCGFTMKQCREIVSPIVLASGRKLDREWISESLASVNLVQFANRLNYRVYKNAYKRFGKRLDMVSCIEGGRSDLRETASWDDAKRLHAHLSIQQPGHLDYEQFTKIMRQEWLSTDWGYNEMHFAPYNRDKDFEKYQTKTGLDAIRLDSTYFSAPTLTNRTGISSKKVQLA